MKLELKHLAGYLPYGLKMYWEDNQHRPQAAWELKPESVDFVLYNQNKPILRPLSDLTKEIEVNGEKFVPNKNLKFGENKLRTINHSKLLNETSFSAIQKLLEWHFDIYGLIKNDLAIDINTLQL